LNYKKKREINININNNVKLNKPSENMRLLSHEQKRHVIDDFTEVKLSYENIIHKKVYCDFVLAIPEGKKCLVWFTKTTTGDNICYVLEVGNGKKQITDVSVYNTCSCSTLCYGTVLQGTLFRHDRRHVFCVEDLLHYKGEEIRHQTWRDKLVLLNHLFLHDVSAVTYNDDFLAFGLPIMKYRFEDLMNHYDQIPYKVKCVQFRKYDNVNMSQFLLINRAVELFNTNKAFPVTKKQDLVFKVKPECQPDIYSLYCMDDSSEEPIYYGIASIPDYKTSVMMNRLFRTIKENENLDALEESDEETEFENEAEDKFVSLNTELNMICSYHTKFKKWVPLRQSLIKDDSEIVNLHELNN
jgi:hypothetical protein